MPQVAEVGLDLVVVVVVLVVVVVVPVPAPAPVGVETGRIGIVAVEGCVAGVVAVAAAVVVVGTLLIGHSLFVDVVHARRAAG